MSDAVGLENKVHHKVYHEVYHGMGTMFYNNPLNYKLNIFSFFAKVAYIFLRKIQPKWNYCASRL